jgi:sec-independent protein translocase protein TatB
MFNIGGAELLAILVIALIVLGPQRLPDAARQVGKVMGDLRRLSTGFQDEMKQALDTADDPTRVAARRNVLATETVTPPAAPAADDAATTESIAAVTAQPSAPGKQTAPAGQQRSASKKAAPTRRARPLQAAPAEPDVPPTAAEPPAPHAQP